MRADRADRTAERLVLFVCSHNAGRSQMAQALFERLAPPGMRAESAGTEPAQAIWPEVVQVMQEVGIEIGDRTPKELTPEMQRRASVAVTMGCGDACPYVAAPVVEWDLPDPRGRPIEQLRALRDEIRELVRGLLATLETTRPQA